MSNRKVQEFNQTEAPA